MGFLFRIFILTVVIYFFIKIIKNIFSPKQQKQSKVSGKSHQTVAPPPYDPNSVEDIDFKEVKKKDGGPQS